MAFDFMKYYGRPSGEVIPEEPTFTPTLPDQLTELDARGSYLAETNGGIVLRVPGLPDVPVPVNSATLFRLNNADIMRLRLRVPVRERMSPYEPYPEDWPKRRI